MESKSTTKSNSTAERKSTKSVEPQESSRAAAHSISLSSIRNLTFADAQSGQEKEAQKVEKGQLSGKRLSSAPVRLSTFSTTSPGRGKVSPWIQRGIRSATGGESLNAGSQNRMEKRFNADLSGVRIHNNSQAHAFNKSIGSEAFTVGNHIFFGRGNYQPFSPSGQDLLAHEVTHTLQQSKSGRPEVQAKFITDAKGNMTDYEFEVGKDIRVGLMTRAKSLVADGVLSNKDMESLRAYLIKYTGTVSEIDRMFIAGMLDPLNAMMVGLAPTKAGTKFRFTTASITQANYNKVANLKRQAAPGVDTSGNFLIAKFYYEATGDAVKAQDAQQDYDDFQANERKEIAKIGGKQYATQIAKLLKYAKANNLSYRNIRRAMINAASDSSRGDQVYAGIVFAIASQAGDNMADHVREGRVKVDAMTPGAFHKVIKDKRVVAGYKTMAGLNMKGDTVYVKTNLDIEHVFDRSAVIHELQHTRDDFAQSKTGNFAMLNSTQVEYDAYQRQAKYIMDQINAATGAAQKSTIAQEFVNKLVDVVLVLMVAETVRDSGKYRAALELILGKAPAPFTKNAAGVTTLLGKGAAVFDKAARDGINKAYGFKAGSQTPMDGQSGEGYVHWIFR